MGLHRGAVTVRPVGAPLVLRCCLAWLVGLQVSRSPPRTSARAWMREVHATRLHERKRKLGKYGADVKEADVCRPEDTF